MNTLKRNPSLFVLIRVHLRAVPFALILAAGAASAAPPLPAMVNEEFPGFRELGEGTLRFLTIHVYDSSVWIKGPKFAPTEPFALEIRYAINIKGKSLTERSIKEMRGLGYTDEAKLKRWEAEMDRVFPDLKPGDRIVGVHVPSKGTRFYSADKFLGAVEDPEFARAFFGIWLDEKTSEPKLRAKMLALER
jgi:hypothetical protein